MTNLSATSFGDNTVENCRIQKPCRKWKHRFKRECKRNHLTVTWTQDIVDGFPPVNAIFTADVTGGKGPYTYLWNFGDGTTSSEKNPAHTYISGGVYSLSLKVTDKKGKQAFLTDQVRIRNPKIFVSANQDIIHVGEPDVSSFSISFWGKAESYTPVWSSFCAGQKFIIFANCGDWSMYNNMNFALLTDPPAKGPYGWGFIQYGNMMGQGWMYITATFTPGDMRLYVNGTLVQTRTDVTGVLRNETLIDPFQIGKYHGSPESYLDGAIWDFRLYDRALSEQEVQTIYQSDGEDIISSGLLGTWCK